MGEDLTRHKNLILFDGPSFFISDLNGDVEDAEEAEGYFHDDVRYLSRWLVEVDGDRLEGITARAVDYYAGRVHAAPSREQPRYSIRRDRFVSEGVHEDLVVTSHCAEEQRLTVVIRFASDFADVADAQKGEEDKRGRLGVTRAERDGSVTLTYQRDSFECSTRIRFSEECAIDDDHVSFAVVLPPHGEWKTCIDITALAGKTESEPLLRCESFDTSPPEMPMPLAEWLERTPDLETDDEDLAHTYRRSLLDLVSLRIRPRKDIEFAMPAGGIPWFMTLFGRDSIIASYEALPYQSSLAEATLQTLAKLQATQWDDYRDAEPGKIPHELRRGKLAKLGEIPQTPYYGTHDATLLWLILLDEYERWTGDAELVRKLWPTAQRALAWLDGYADLDGDGFLEYRSRSSGGLNNLCWKDSDDSILFADGRHAEPPIATCELQGYAYDARLRSARLARLLWEDDPLAERLESDAAALKERFNSEFWNEDRGTFLLALAGPEKARIDSVTSNPGHCLWSGIVDEDKAARVVDRLLRRDMFSGWGIRSMSSEDTGYSPLRYHNGTVWPHDTAIVAAGIRRYGFREEAKLVGQAILEATAAFQHQLPEVFAGFARDRADVPVRYPEALAPQSWAAGAPLLALHTLLGLDPAGDELRTDSLVAGVRLRGLAFRGRMVDVP